MPRERGTPSMFSIEGIEAFLRREVLPHAADSWYPPDTDGLLNEILELTGSAH